MSQSKTSWIDAALNKLDMLNGMELTGEQIRVLLTHAGVPAPHHHNVWGAFINRALNDGSLQETGVYKHMMQPRSHGRKTPVYIVTAYYSVPAKVA